MRAVPVCGAAHVGQPAILHPMDHTSDVGRTLATWLPSPTLCAWAPIDAAPTFRHADEARVVERAVPVRAREFATGRRLAHALLAELGCADVPLLPGDDRAPRWPSGVTGSIAHCREGCVVIAAPRADVDALGVDVEPASPLDAPLWRIVLRDEEQRALRTRSAHDGGRLAKAAFCAKEAVYKALSARIGRRIDFTDVALDADALTAAPVDEGASWSVCAVVRLVDVPDVQHAPIDAHILTCAGLLFAHVRIPRR